MKKQFLLLSLIIASSLYAVNNELHDKALNSLADKKAEQRENDTAKPNMTEQQPDIDDSPASPEALAEYMAMLDKLDRQQPQMHKQNTPQPRWYHLVGALVLSVVLNKAVNALAGATDAGLSAAASAGARGLRHVFSRRTARPNVPAYVVDLANFGGNNPAPHWDYSGCF